MKAIVEAGLQAPSAGNNQPWQYIYKFGRLYLFHNVGRSRNHWDKMHMTAGIAMGASITNINLMSNNLGYKVESKMFYENLEHPDQPVAVLTFEKCEVIKNDLTSQIFKRSTNRLNLKSERITSSQLDDLLSISENEDINFTYFTRKGDIDKLGLILGKAEQIRLLNPIGHSDFVREVRWTPEEAETTKDALNLLKEKKIIGKLNEWNKGSGVQKMITEGTSECGAIGMIWGTQSDYNTYIKGGKALQKMWLKATSLGIHLHPYASFPVLLNEFNINQDNLQKQEKKAVQNLKEEFQLLVRNKDTVPLLFYRLNKTNITTVKSYRRSILEALVQ